MKTFVAAAALLAASVQIGRAETTLHVMSWQTAYVAGTPYWDKTVAGFEAENPGVKVESNFVAFGQYLPTLTAMIAGDSLPDVFNGGTKTGELGRAGLLVNFKDAFDQKFFDQFFAGPLRQYTFDGKPYGLADMAQDFGVFTNDRIMKEVGLSAPDTWDELIADAPKFKTKGYIPLAWGNLTRNTCPDFFLPLVAQYGGDVYALDDHTAAGLSWDSKPVVDALALLERLSKAGVFPPGINGIDDPQSYQLAYQGRAAMFYGGSWTPGIFAHDGSKDWLDNFSVHKVPAVTAGGVHFTGDGAGEAWSVNAKSPNKDLALKFIAYLYRPEVYNWRAKGLQSFPALKSAVDQIDNSKVRTMIPWIETDAADHILFGPGSWESVSNVCQAALDGSITPQDGAKKIETDVMAARAANKRLAGMAERMPLSRRWRGWIAPALFIAPAALAILLTMAAPMAYAVLLSLQSWNGMAPPRWVGLKNYVDLAGDGVFLRALGHTAYFTICTVILQTVLPLLLASLLSSGVRGSAFFRTLYFMPVIISLAISGLLWAMLFEPNFGAINNILRAAGLGSVAPLWLADGNTVMPSVIIVSVWQSLGFYLVIFFAALQGVPRDLYEAAELDGADAWRRFLNISVPSIWPVILFVIVLNTINGVKVFDQIWVMTAGGPNYASATLGTYLYSIAFGAMGASNSRLGYATAVAMVIVAFSLIVSVVQICLGRRRDLDSQIEA